MKLKALLGALSLYHKEGRLSLLNIEDIKDQSSKSALQVLGSEKLGLVHFRENPKTLKAVGNLDISPFFLPIALIFTKSLPVPNW